MGARNQDQEHIRHTRSGQGKGGASPLTWTPQRDQHLTLRQHGPTLNHHLVSAVPIKGSPTWLDPPVLAQPTGLSFYLYAILDLDQSHCFLFWMLLHLPPWATFFSFNVKPWLSTSSISTSLVHHLINKDSISGGFCCSLFSLHSFHSPYLDR